MASAEDTIANYGQALGWDLRRKTVLVEGTTDVTLMRMAAKFEFEKTGIDLLADSLAIIPAGEGDQGGARGVLRELNALRCLSRACFLPNGRPKYRFIGLFDNDDAGRRAINGAQQLDLSILEYKDVFRLRPVMPTSGNLDPKTLETSFDKSNINYKGLDWELEDLLPESFFLAFRHDYPSAIKQQKKVSDKTHREFTWDGKAQLHRFVKENAVHSDLSSVVQLLRSLRFYLSLPVI